MSSEPKKVVNLDRPHDEESRDNSIDSNPKDDVDRLLSDFLEHINTLSSEYETAGPHAGPEEPIADIPLSPVSETIANMAAALQQPTPFVPAPAGRHDTTPLPFGRDTADLDEEIELALRALEELPAARDEPPAEGGTAEATEAGSPDRLEPAPLATATMAVEPGAEPPESAEAPVEPLKEVIASVTPIPSVQEEVRPVFTYSPYTVGKRRIVVALAIFAAVGLLVLAIYLLTTRSRSVPPGVGTETGTPQPPQPSIATSQPSSEVPHSEVVIPAIENQPQTIPSTVRPIRQRSYGTANLNPAMRNGPDQRERQPEPQKPSSPPAPVPSALQKVSVPPVENTQQSAPAAAPQQVQSPPTSTAVQAAALSTPAPAPPGTQPAETSSAPSRSGESNGQQAPASPPATPPAVSRPPSPMPATVTSAPAGAKPVPSATVKSATPAELISKVLPSFPDFARRINQTGKVDVEIEIDARGRVTQAKPVSGPSIFHAAATEAVKKWVFKPATLNGNSVSSQGRVTVVFNKR